MKCELYQTDNRDWRFESWDWAMTHGFDQLEYKRVCTTTSFPDNTTLNEIFEIFDTNHPDNYNEDPDNAIARSIAVSDVIVIRDRENDPYAEVETYYVDSFGFVELSHDFWEDGLFEED